MNDEYGGANDNTPPPEAANDNTPIQEVTEDNAESTATQPEAGGGVPNEGAANDNTPPAVEDLTTTEQDAANDQKAPPETADALLDDSTGQYKMPWADFDFMTEPIDQTVERGYAAQGNPKYPGTDAWAAKNLEAGEIIAALSPGKGGFCTPAWSIAEAGFDAEALGRGLQVRPQDGNFREQVTLYRIKGSTGGAEAVTDANPERRDRPSGDPGPYLPGFTPTSPPSGPKDGGLTQYYFPCDLAGRPDLFKAIGTFSLDDLNRNPDLSALLKKPPTK